MNGEEREAKRVKLDDSTDSEPETTEVIEQPKGDLYLDTVSFNSRLEA
jgi:hypothetical protein